MAVFAVMTPRPSTELAAAVVREFKDNYYEIGPGQYLVAAQGLTTKDITERLGAQSGMLGQIVILATSSYYGWHIKDVWEWIQVKS